MTPQPNDTPDSSGQSSFLWSDPKPFGYIYLISNTVNKRVYVGQTIVSVSLRWIQHLSRSRATRKQYPLYHAINKYGADVFSVKVLATATDRTTLNLKERILIRAYRALEKEHGYNCRAGGHHGGLMSEETKAKLSAANRGRVHAPEFGARISALQRGRKQSPEWIANRTAGQKGKKMPPRSLEYKEKQRQAKLGKKQSEETKELRAAAHRGRKNTPETIEKMRQAAYIRMAKNGGKMISPKRTQADESAH